MARSCGAMSACPEASWQAGSRGRMTRVSRERDGRMGSASFGRGLPSQDSLHEVAEEVVPVAGLGPAGDGLGGAAAERPAARAGAGLLEAAELLPDLGPGLAGQVGHI